MQQSIIDKIKEIIPNVNSDTITKLLALFSYKNTPIAMLEAWQYDQQQRLAAFKKEHGQENVSDSDFAKHLEANLCDIAARQGIYLVADNILINSTELKKHGFDISEQALLARHPNNLPHSTNTNYLRGNVDSGCISC